MNVLKSLPPEAAALSAKAQWKFRLLANRVQIGAFLIACCVAIGARVEFKGKDEVIHALEAGIILAVSIAGGGLVGAGAFKSNGEHEQQMNRQIKQTTGQYPVVHPHRRAADGERWPPLSGPLPPAPAPPSRPAANGRSRR